MLFWRPQSFEKQVSRLIFFTPIPEAHGQTEIFDETKETSSADAPSQLSSIRLQCKEKWVNYLIALFHTLIVDKVLERAVRHARMCNVEAHVMLDGDIELSYNLVAYKSSLSFVTGKRNLNSIKITTEYAAQVYWSKTK